jgi:hypothetical protein
MITKTTAISVVLFWEFLFFLLSLYNSTKKDKQARLFSQRTCTKKEKKKAVTLSLVFFSMYIEDKKKTASE